MAEHYQEQLAQDHEDIRTMLMILVEMSNRVEEDQAVPPGDLEKVVRFLDVFVGQAHNSKEETLLYPALEEAGLQRENGPVGVMLAEHEISQNYANGFRDAAARYVAGDTNAGPILAEYARNYAMLLSRHLDEEDGIVFPVAAEKLSADRKRELGEQFDALEDQTMGGKRHEEWHKLTHELAESYLN